MIRRDAPALRIAVEQTQPGCQACNQARVPARGLVVIGVLARVSSCLVVLLGSCPAWAWGGSSSSATEADLFKGLFLFLGYVGLFIVATGLCLANAVLLFALPYYARVRPFARWSGVCGACLGLLCTLLCATTGYLLGGEKSLLWLLAIANLVLGSVVALLSWRQAPLR